ncbi:hypothetical protein RI129_007654 [Pyrocoelia pectoralis]|uniref:Uncharacterized protein n=1 Tax=Pyrocoelia pectoralis TaxID=417401 RepID=A0AAN7VCS0_9COLE
MEFNQKSRGQKHHKNKARYKPKQDGKKKGHTTHKNNPLPQKSLEDKKDELEISSSSSDDEFEDEVEEAVELNDFTLLAQAPISVGGHFQFKRDKNMETGCDFKTLRENNFFSLDLNILQYSLGCIPFHERCGMDKSYFTESEIEAMNARAHSNQVQYESYLKISAINKKDSETNDCRGDNVSQFGNLNLKESYDNKITDISHSVVDTKLGRLFISYITYIGIYFVILLEMYFVYKTLYIEHLIY